MNTDNRSISWKETEFDDPETGKNQQTSSLPRSTKNELRELAELTQRQYQSTPNVVDYYQNQQSG